MKRLIAYALLLLMMACKKESAEPTRTAKNLFTQKAKTFLQQQMPPQDFAVLDWNKARVYTRGGIEKTIRVPLLGNTTALQPAVYLTCNGTSFTGNYIAVTESPLAGSTFITTSLDKVKRQEAKLTAEGRISSYKNYEKGRMIFDSELTNSFVSIAAIRVYFTTSNGSQYMWIMNSGGGGGQFGGVGYEPNNSQLTQSYVQVDGDPELSPLPVLTVNFVYIANVLGLSQAEADWLADNPLEAVQVQHYLAEETLPEKYEIAKEHVRKMMNDSAYLDFSRQHTYNGLLDIVWWKDTNWLYNPANFSLGVPENSAPVPTEDLTWAEKLLVVQYPIHAYTIKQNVQPAKALTEEKMGIPGGLNDKKDAFRHAFFQALNTKTVPDAIRLFGANEPGHEIVKKFADAHESEVPPQLLLEKQMDLFNNQVGINLCLPCAQNGTSAEAIAALVMQQLTGGFLRYLSPLDRNNFPPFDQYNPNCTNCTNGIVPGVTQLTPTNQ